MGWPKPRASSSDFKRARAILCRYVESSHSACARVGSAAPRCNGVQVNFAKMLEKAFKELSTHRCQTAPMVETVPPRALMRAGQGDPGRLQLQARAHASVRWLVSARAAVALLQSIRLPVRALRKVVSMAG